MRLCNICTIHRSFGVGVDVFKVCVYMCVRASEHGEKHMTYLNLLLDNTGKKNPNTEIHYWIRCTRSNIRLDYNVLTKNSSKSFSYPCTTTKIIRQSKYFFFHIRIHIESVCLTLSSISISLFFHMAISVSTAHIYFLIAIFDLCCLWIV